MQTLYVVSIPTISGKIFGRIFFSLSRLKILFDSNQIEMLLVLDNTSSIICAFGLAAAAPRSPYRHLELCGIAIILNFTRNRGEIQCQTHQHPAQKKFSDFTFFNKKAIFSRAKWCIMIQNMGVCVHFGTPRRQRGRNGVSGTFPLPEQPPPALAPHPQLVDKRRMTF